MAYLYPPALARGEESDNLGYPLMRHQKSQQLDKIVQHRFFPYYCVTENSMYCPPKDEGS